MVTGSGFRAAAAASAMARAVAWRCEDLGAGAAAPPALGAMPAWGRGRRAVASTVVASGCAQSSSLKK